jgi:hypothetical protein
MPSISASARLSQWAIQTWCRKESDVCWRSEAVIGLFMLGSLVTLILNKTTR